MALVSRVQAQRRDLEPFREEESWSHPEEKA